ncbi:Pogo transposable element with KRAB domainlike [Phytophthora cinnamomi]|uniref:Pogo transposable element with KRAB domainlike n=1 Tax=Phytophthora cinnamomi TaxID=4785 RepID=UPI0035595F9A|nr:Pogo transposable element with KRAB domainlike [Phytophthora cinnamomi]
MVKARCTAKGVQVFVIPGGLTLYVQAGDIGIYKSFKDKLSPITDSWKKSDDVLCSRGGNPKLPSVETVANWVNVAWRDVSADVWKEGIGENGNDVSDNGGALSEDCFDELTTRLELVYRSNLSTFW